MQKSRADGPTAWPHPTAPLAAVLDTQRRAVDAAMRAQQSLSSGAARMAEHIAEFGGRRIEDDQRVLGDVAACKTPFEAVSVCSAATLSMWSAYLEEWNRLASDMFETMRAATEDSVAPVEKRRDGSGRQREAQAPA
jgi:Phasin protein.